jgi:3-oxoacyl-[acyl-carrier protein] reductase
MSNYDFTGKLSVITGGAGGIGRAVAESLARCNSDITIIDINKEAGEEFSSYLNKKYSIRSIFYSCNISNYKTVNKTCEEIIAQFGKVDNLITASGYDSKTAIDKMDISEWKRAIDINLNGTFYIIHALVGQMISQAKANIIIIGSATVLTGSGGGIHYAASKVAQYGIMKGLSYELLSKGIRTNIITPHIIDTPMLRKRYPDTLEVNKKLSARTPIGRIGTPQDIANIALFLASDESAYICGAEIIADGGGIYYQSSKKAQKS